MIELYFVYNKIIYQSLFILLSSAKTDSSNLFLNASKLKLESTCSNAASLIYTEISFPLSSSISSITYINLFAHYIAPPFNKYPVLLSIIDSVGPPELHPRTMFPLNIASKGTIPKC